MKKFFSAFVCLIFCLTLFAGVACTEQSADNGEGSSQSFSGDSQSAPASFDDVFDYTYSPAETTKNIEQPSAQAKTDYPLFDAMYNMAESDGSYSGTDTGVGFPSRLARTEDAFETVPVGYGAGTTGGRGATAENTYTCSSRADIIAALDSIKNKLSTDPDLKSILLINGTIVEDTTISDGYQVIVSGVKNVSFLGLENATLDGLGLNFKSVDNVIVQNLTVHHPNKSKKQEKDCLEFNNCNYVWVDHCELFNDYPEDSAEKDYYDGLLDIKNVSSHITVSYNYLHDAWKTSLVGSGPDDIFDTRTVTYHHNIFENCNSRQPMMRGGRLHVYNNLYINVLNRGTDCRYGATAYIENNVYINCKKPVGWFEEPQGYYNLSGNLFDENCKEVPKSSTCDFTPSYEYILDDAENVETFVQKHAGVGKTDIETAIAFERQDEYVVDEGKVLDRSIEEIGQVSLDHGCLQKLLYCTKEVLFGKTEVVSALENVDLLEEKVNEYFNLYAADTDARINGIDKEGAFDVNCKNTFRLSTLVNGLNEYISTRLTSADKLTQLVSYYKDNFATLFNAQASTLTSPAYGDMETIINLLELYYGAESALRTGADIEVIKKAYTDCKNVIAVADFTAIVDALPDAAAISFADKSEITLAISAYNDLTEHQKYLVEKAVISRYMSVIDAYNKYISATKRMDLSSSSAGRTSQVTKVGDIYVGVSTDIRKNLSVTYGGITYDSAVFLSGYGNTGSKCLQFTLYSKSDLTIVLATEGGKGKFLITDKNKNVIRTFDADATLQAVSIEGMPAGEYRLFTDIPSGTYTTAKAFIYEFVIKPNRQ